MTSNFVKIKNSVLSPIDVDRWIKEKRREDGFSPLLAYEVLERTNHYANLKFVVNEILKKPKEEWYLYKSFVLGAIERRLHSDYVYGELKKLAEEGGYLQEFSTADSWRKVYFPKTCRVFYPNYVKEKVLSEPSKNYDTIFITQDAGDISFDSVCRGFKRLLLNKEERLPQYCCINEFYEIVFAGCDLSNVEDISVSSSVNLHFENIELNEVCSKLIKKNSHIYMYNCDFEKIKDKKFECNNSSEVELYGSKNLPSIMDLSGCSSFRGDTETYEGVKEFILGKSVVASLVETSIMPEVIRLNECAEVEFSKCDFKDIKEFIVNNVKDLRFYKIENLDSCEIDFSKSERVEISNCVYNRGGVKFAEGSVVSLSNVYLPDGLDLSTCESLYVKEVSNAFSGPKLNCNDLYISNCVTFPEELDFSNISCGILFNSGK